MTQLLERSRPRRAFASADILSLLGETICLPIMEEIVPTRREIRPTSPALPTPSRIIDEDPERWDGLA